MTHPGGRRWSDDDEEDLAPDGNKEGEAPEESDEAELGT